MTQLPTPQPRTPRDARQTDGPSPESMALNRRLNELVPGGCHTYAKGDDQYPRNAPQLIVRGKGCRAWDVDGREFIEYGMGLRAVTLGHAFEPVLRAARDALELGTNFSRPSPIELQCAEQFLDLVRSAEMVKFCKNGSDALDGAVRLARAYTGRDMVAICGDHPFFSTGDWFIGTTEMNAGIPLSTCRQVVKFRYNDLDSLRALFAAHPQQIACVVMEPARIEEPAPGHLEAVRATAHRAGALLVFDEMITGLRWHNGGAQQVYGVAADLSTFGKALANGFAVSALAGRREVMQLGGADHPQPRVFLLSTTHGAETHELAAALATMRFHAEHPVVQTLHERGARLRRGFDRAVAAHGLGGLVEPLGRDCCLLFATRDADKEPSQAFRALFMQELIARGVLAPSFVVSYSHDERDIDRTIEAIDGALAVYRRALEDGVQHHLRGNPVKPVFRRFA